MPWGLIEEFHMILKEKLKAIESAILPPQKANILIQDKRTIWYWWDGRRMQKHIASESCSDDARHPVKDLSRDLPRQKSVIRWYDCKFCHIPLHIGSCLRDSIPYSATEPCTCSLHTVQLRSTIAASECKQSSQPWEVKCMQNILELGVFRSKDILVHSVKKKPHKDFGYCTVLDCTLRYIIQCFPFGYVLNGSPCCYL
jgi:hypothetical protein